jgi:general secretion pathway protein D
MAQYKYLKKMGIQENTVNKKIQLLLLTIILAGCVSQPLDSPKGEPSAEDRLVQESYLSKLPLVDEVNTVKSSEVEEVEEVEEVQAPDSNTQRAAKPNSMRVLQALEESYDRPTFLSQKSVSFSEVAEVAVASDELPVKDFVHYIFGEILDVSYVLDPAIAGVLTGSPGVSLSIKDKLSKQRLFELTRRVLGEREIAINLVDGVYFIKPGGQSAADNISVGVGNRASDVPAVGQKIMQIVPLDFGIKIFVPQLLTEIIKARITPNYQTNVIMIEGEREEVLRAMELIDMFDIPSSKGRYIGVIDLTYVDAEESSQQVVTLLNSEGVDAKVHSTNDETSVSLIPLPSLGAVAVFATADAQLQRVAYWFGVVDQPKAAVDGIRDQIEYFSFKPKYAQVNDIAKDFRALMVGANSGSASASTEIATGQAPNEARSNGINTVGMTMSVNKRAKKLMFRTSGAKYRSLLPILTELDVPLNQIVLDMVIAEVSLKDEFKHGVEWAVKRGEVSLTTQGAFGAAGIGGFGIGIAGSEGPLTANFIGSNSLVKVLSNPTMMVIEGESASFTVGSSISVVGQTTQDPISGQRQTSSSEYRNTGLEVSVTPEVLAGSMIKMVVSESISNTVPGTSGSGANPDIFTRALETVVMAPSGQTIMLAGLISENASTGGSGTPGLSKIPVLGNLFKARSKVSDRSELIILITPKLLKQPSEWERVRDEFESQLKVFYK